MSDIDRRAGAAPARRRTSGSLTAEGEPVLWLATGALGLALAMIVSLIALVVVSGLLNSWPRDVPRYELDEGRVVLGEVRRDEVDPAGAASGENGDSARRLLVATGNFRVTGTHFTWISEREVIRESAPEWALVVEQLEWGRCYGMLEAMVTMHDVPLAASSAGRTTVASLEPEISALGRDIQARGAELRLLLDGTAPDGTDGVLVALDAAAPDATVLGIAETIADHDAAWQRFQELHPEVLAMASERQRLEREVGGRMNRQLEEARLEARGIELDLEAATRARDDKEVAALRELLAAHARGVTALNQAMADELAELRGQTEVLDAGCRRHRLVLAVEGEEQEPARLMLLPLGNIVRAYAPNRLDWWGRLQVYASRWWELLTAEPREANSEGGIYPAIVGTVIMTLVMSIFVLPFGVLAALYLSEYAKRGPVTSAVRIAINNLAGVPSIVFGVFGLGFFCYVIGASIDELLFAERLPNPTYGKGGLLWASLTLALLTLPVVIVATEEALAAVGNSLREGSLACGATRWQTIRRVVLPHAMPGVLTGLILAIARGAGEVAPLMLVGAVKLAPELPLDGEWPFFHLDRSFMHLGFHIYDLGFQSQNSEAARPLVFATTLLLLAIVCILNVVAVWLRNRMRRRLQGSAF